MNSHIYKPNINWWIMEGFKFTGISFGVAYLFFNSPVAAIGVAPVFYILIRKDKEKYIVRMKSVIREEFKDMITILSGSINAGYSLENGFIRAVADMEKADRDYRYILPEMRRLINGMGLNRSVEELLFSMSQSLDVEEIMDFAGLVATAKVYGGDIVHLISQTRKSLNDRITVETEIATLIAAKKLEGKIMLLMPFLIVAYMRITNGSYMNYMYETLLGKVIMAVAFVVIVIMGLIIDRIVRIEV